MREPLNWVARWISPILMANIYMAGLLRPGAQRSILRMSHYRRRH